MVGNMARRKKRKTHYSGIGGQAVLEGVMMKNKDDYAIAVRKSDGTIDVDVEVYHPVLNGIKVRNAPFIRGVFNFVDSLVLGMHAINHSSMFYEDGDAKETRVDKALDSVSGGKGENILMAFTTILSIVLALALFILLPYFLTQKILVTYVRNDSVLAIIEGVIRILIFLGYVSAISLMKDIKRLYQYHGAEHKCINCIERGHPLTVEDVMKSSRFHKRCGTSFIFIVFIISAVLFFFIRVDSPIQRVLLRLLLIPVIAGLSYECIRLAGRSDNLFVRIISAPGLALQRITTREPDESMAEVAIRSVEAVFDWKAYILEEFGYDYREDDPDDNGYLEEEFFEEEESAADAREAERVLAQFESVTASINTKEIEEALSATQPVALAPEELRETEEIPVPASEEASARETEEIPAPETDTTPAPEEGPDPV